MNDIVFNTSILRVKEIDNRVDKLSDEEKQKALNNYDNGVLENYIEVKYNGEYFILVKNEDFYYACVKNKVKYINMKIIDISEKDLKQTLLNSVKKNILNPMNVAYIYNELSTFFNISQRNLSIEINKTQGAISNKKRLLVLPLNVQIALLQNKIKERHARGILQMRNCVDFEEKSNFVLKNILDNKLKVQETEDLIYKILNKPIGIRDSLNIKKVKSNKDFKEPIVGSIVSKVDSELEKTLENIQKYFPNLEIQLEQGIDREDYVFLLKLKGINNG